MATFNIPFNEEFRGWVIEVIKNVRRQQYTPELLCEHQKILECMYFYWCCLLYTSDAADEL